MGQNDKEILIDLLERGGFIYIVDDTYPTIYVKCSNNRVDFTFINNKLVEISTQYE